MKKIDCLSDMCPLPVLKLQKELDKGIEELILVTDHSCVIENIKDFLSHKQLYYEIEEIISGIWEITISKNKKKS